MFGRLHAARILEAKLHSKRMKDNDDAQTMLTVVITYDFTEGLAESIGGVAPQVQTMLAQAGDGVKMARAGLVLDVAEVGVIFKSGDGVQLKIAHAMKLKARGCQPAASQALPALAVAVSFAIENDEPLAFMRENLGELCKVRMDRAQLELPAIEPPNDAP